MHVATMARLQMAVEDIEALGADRHACKQNAFAGTYGKIHGGVDVSVDVSVDVGVVVVVVVLALVFVLVLPPSPNCPLLSAPQHLMSPLSRMAQV